jgi:hypothetical protein
LYLKFIKSKLRDAAEANLYSELCWDGFGNEKWVRGCIELRFQRILKDFL